MNEFLANRRCTTGGKHAYFRAIRAFANWLARNDYLEDNPLKKVDPPKPAKAILPSLTTEQVDHLIRRADNPRDKCTISLLANIGMRLGQLASIKGSDVDRESFTVTIWENANKQEEGTICREDS